MSSNDESNEWLEDEDVDDDSDDDRIRSMWPTREEEELTDEELDAHLADLQSRLHDLDLREHLTEQEYEGLDRSDPVAVEQAIAVMRTRKAAAIKREKEAASATQPVPETEIKLVTSKDLERPPAREMPESLRDARRCEHIRADNRQCASPARNHGRFCYFHDQSRSGSKNKKRMKMPVLEDQRALQMAVTKVCQSISDESIDVKRASTLLYGLQVAASAVKSVSKRKRR